MIWAKAADESSCALSAVARGSLAPPSSAHARSAKERVSGDGPKRGFEMPVIVALVTGEKYMLDRGYTTAWVAGKLAESAENDALVQFDNNATPRRQIFIRPSTVVAITHDGHDY